MSRGLRSEDAFGSALEECDRCLRLELGVSALEALELGGEGASLEDPALVWPAIFAVQVALVAQLRAWGVAPEAVLGHSIGEISAAHAAGALALADAARIICVQGRLASQSLGEGEMLAVSLGPRAAEREIADFSETLSVAIHSGLESSVVAGETEALSRLRKRLEHRGVSCRRVRTGVAAHTRQMEPHQGKLLRALESIRPRPAAVPLFSSVEGTEVRGEQLGPGYWWRNLRNRVLFAEAARRALAGTSGSTVEVSPHPVLVPVLAQQLSPASRVRLVGTLVRGRDAKEALLGAVDRLTSKASSVASESGPSPPSRGSSDGRAEVLAWLRSQTAELTGRPIEEIDPARCFLELGVDSLLAMRLTARIEHRYGAAPDLLDLLDRPLEDIAGPLVDTRPTDAGPRIVPRPEERFEPFPMTTIQKAYWLGRTGAFRGSSGIHMYQELDCEDLNVARLDRAWAATVQRHEMLRVRSLPGFEQEILRDVRPRIATVDLRGLSEARRKRELARLRDALSHTVYELSRWPLHRILACRLADRTTRLVLSHDLWPLDLSSLALVFRDWVHFYRDPTAALQPVPVSYRDYSQCLESDGFREQSAYRRDLDYWRARSDGLPSAPELPLRADAGGRRRFRRLEVSFSPDHWQAFRDRAARFRVTPNAAVAAVFCEILARWSRNRRFTLNVTLLNRLPLHPEIHEVAGDFTSMIPLAVDVRPHRPFSDRAASLRDRLHRDMAHAKVSGIEIQQMVARGRGARDGGLFPVVLTSVLGQRHQGFHYLDALGARRYKLTQTPQVDLDHQVYEDDGRLVLVWDFVPSVYPEDMIEDMFEAYTAAVRRLAREPAAWTASEIARLPERQVALRRDANATDAPVPDGLLHERFVDRCAEHPDKVCLVTPEAHLTYAEVAARSRRIAHRLRGLGLRPEEPVGVLLAHGVDQVTAAFGVLEAGGAYLPLPIDAPPAYVQSLLEEAAARFVLSDRPEDPGNTGRARMICVSEETGDAHPRPSALPPQVEPVPDRLAYVLFTSGSTGRPKGVMVSHRSVVNRMEDVVARFGLTGNDVAFGLTAHHHDLSVFDRFCVLGLLGATLVLPEANRRRDPGHWCELMECHRVTLWNSVPAFMSMLVESSRSRAAEEIPRSLRWAILSGDFIPVDLPERMESLFGSELQVVPAGGPTETTVWDIAHALGPVDPGWRTIPYGRPLSNARYFVLDEDLRERPVWVPGELCIGGAGLARGYLGQPSSTASRFVPHPETGERIYRSGDLGRRLPDGEIEILGRTDFQVQIQGHRVELGEIEQVLGQHPEVSSAAVVAHGEAGRRRLTAYVTLTTAETAEEERLPSQEGGFVPSYPGSSRTDRLALLLDRPGRRKDLDPKHALPLENTSGELELGLGTALGQRRSVRTFGPHRPRLEQIGKLLGSLREHTARASPVPRRLYPSAGSLYAVQTYLYAHPGRIEGLLGGGVSYHDPSAHALIPLVEGTEISPEAHVPWNRETASQAAFTLLFFGRPEAVEPLYGHLSERFLSIEAGAMAQLLMMVAPDLGLGLCPVGDLDHAGLRPSLGLEEGHPFLLAMLGGVPAVPGRRRHTAVSDAADPRLQTYLAERLPPYAVPSNLIFLDALPLTANGKVDRDALSVGLGAPRRHLSGEYSPPKDDLQVEVATVVGELLGAPRVGLDDNFFELGGTSTGMIELHTRLRERTGRDFPVVEMFAHPTVAALASLLRAGHERDRGDDAPATGRERAQRRIELRRRVEPTRRRR